MTNIKNISLDEIRAMKDSGQLKESPEDAPTKDMPDGFWDDAKVVKRAKKKSVHLRIDPDVLEFFQADGPGHLTRMNDVLRSYMIAIKEKNHHQHRGE